MPEPELSVLVRLQEAGGALQQNEVAAAMGWDRTRLSHLLTRMEARGEVERTKMRNGVKVRLLPVGHAVIETARPALESAVRRHLIDKLSPDEREVLHNILAKLA